MDPTSSGGDYFPDRGSADTEPISDDETQNSDLYFEDIYTIDPPAHRTDLPVAGNKIQDLVVAGNKTQDLVVAESKTQIAGECSECGRCLPRLFALLPFEIDINQISRVVFQNSMRQQSGCQDLSNILLMITPSKESDYEHIMHCYRLDTRRHQGVVTVSQKQLREIEGYHLPDTYSIVRCSRPIDSADAASNSPIKCQIFEAVREGSRAVKTAWYNGQHLRLSIRTNGSKPKVVAPKSRIYSGIVCLRQPKIPVRMQQRLLSKAKPKKTKVRLQAKDSVPKGKAEGQVGQKSIDGVCQREQRSPTRKPTQVDGRERSGRTPLVESSRQKQANAFKANSTDLAPTVKKKRKELVPKTEGLTIVEKAKQTPRKIIANVKDAKQEPRQKRTDVKLPDSDSFFDSSSTFERPMGPAVLPPSFSRAAFTFLKEKLRWPRATRAFPKFRRLVEQINEQETPQVEHLLCFFHMAQDLDFKLYIRREVDCLGCPPTNGRSFVVETYVFDDRREYIASICLPDTHLHALARIFPGARKNFRLVDDAFELTNAPEGLTEWLKGIADVFNARKWYKYLGELFLDFTGAEGAVYEVPEDGEIQTSQPSICGT